MARPLTQDERTKIYTLKKEGRSNAYIANTIRRDPATIGREIKRNKSERGYRPQKAQELADQRRKKTRYRKMTPDVIRFVENKLQEDLAPEQISNTMRQEIECRVSHETIYQHIARDKQNGGKLYTHLRINHKRRYRRRNRRKGDYRTKIPNRIDIAERPTQVEKRQEVGHWEADLVQVSGGYLVTVVERSTRLLRVGSIPFKRAEMVGDELYRLLHPYRDWVKTITYDNGTEFSDHERLNRRLGCGSYFARPYHSWERGSNENANGLIRQYFPKGARGGVIDQSLVAVAESRINSRPRKTLGWRSAAVAFASISYLSCAIATGT
jgi:IS30 family transposase